MALLGRVTPHHVFMLQNLLSHIEFLDEQITLFDARIAEHIRPFQAALDRLDTITGVARRSAEQILAELGDDMSRVPTAAHAASWTGICPGNNESREAQIGEDPQGQPLVARHPGRMRPGSGPGAQ